MATKEKFVSSVQGDQKHVHGTSNSIQDAKYSNLNLISNHKCSIEKSFQSKNGSHDSWKSSMKNNASIKGLDQTFVDHKNDNRMGSSSSWNKNGKSLRSNGFNFGDSQKEDDDAKNRKQWKKDSETSKKNLKSSTLSLHIAAYENSIEAKNGQNNSLESLKSKPKMNNFAQTLKAGIQVFADSSNIEFPRQQEDVEKKPGIQEFRAGQKLLRPNQTSNDKADKKYKGEMMDGLVEFIGQLQSVFSKIQIENQIQLPQIVVVGSQSAGKSSVIEGIVGRDFLPRGTGIVTRRPLLIHLIHTPKDDVRRNEKHGYMNGDWATFKHSPDLTFVDFEKVRGEIQSATDDLTKSNKGISNVPIILRIYSEKVVNLTLIDLPGMTKVPVGDQPLDIEIVIRDMIMEYISNPNSIILAIHPANTDMATSESLKLARDVDKNGDRTLCVLTKLDLMDKGTNAEDVLEGKTLPVKLGIIGVVGRSQADIIANKSVEECLIDEATFFSETYSKISEKSGTPYLREILNKLLMANIRKILPDLRIRIATMKNAYETKLQKLGKPIAENNKARIILKISHDFLSTVISLIDGSSDVIETKEAVGGALIRRIFYDTYAKQMQSIDPLHGLRDDEIVIATSNVQGTTPAIYYNQKVFESIVKKQILLLLEPSLKCVDLVYEELLRIVENCGAKIQMDFGRFPRLFECIKEVTISYLEDQIQKTKDFIELVIESHRAHINTKHPDFEAALVERQMKLFIFEESDAENSFDYKDIFNAAAAASVKFAGSDVVNATAAAAEAAGRQFLKLANRGIKRDDYLETSKILITSYFNVVLKSVQDMVPKFNMEFLVNYLKKELQTSLILKLQEIHRTVNLFEESVETAQRREEVIQMLHALNEAEKVFKQL